MSIEINHLTHIYNKGTPFEKRALIDINLKINDGEFIGLIGHTGSGKLKYIRQKVGLVFQYPEHQLFEMTVYKDVAYGPANLGLEKEEIDQRVRSALETVGLSEDTYDKSPFELSGGQRRRAAIAGVLAMEPEVLILDEPTAGLDPRGRDEILDSIKLMHENRNIIVILVSHSMEDVAKLADRIIVLNDGKVAVTGTPREVFSKVEELEKIGLAAPQISYVFSKLSQQGYDIKKDVYTVAEATEELYKFLKQVK